MSAKAPPPTTEPGRWAWLQRYRLWSANRKVFLYPENELEPEERSRKRRGVKRRP
jgi:hypothetical protein